MSLRTKTTFTKKNNRRLHNPQEINQGNASLELLVEELQSMFTFRAAGLYSRGK
jgi:hypothetical protein